MSSYSEVMWRAITEGLAADPDLWIRHESRHTLSPLGLLWERVETTSVKIEAQCEIEVVGVEKRANRYIIGLVHTGEQEFGIPLGMFIGML